MVKASRKALQIAFGYLIFAALWIFFSDAAVELAVRDSDILTRVQNIKGFAFVLVTAVLLFIFVRRIFAEVEKSHQREMRSARLLNHYLRRTPVIGYALRVKEARPETVWLSENVEAMLGYSGADAMSENWWRDHVHPDDLANAERAFRGFLEEGGELDQEYRFIKANGEVVWIRDQLRFGDTVDGAPLVVGAWSDITEVKALQLKSAMEASRQRVLFKEAHDGIAVHDRDSVLIEANQSFARLIGYDSPDQVIGKCPWEWDARYPDKDAFKTAFPEPPSEPSRFETRFRHPGGKTVEVEISINPVLYGDKPVVFTVCRDITERKAQERQLRELSRELSALFRISNSLRHAHNQTTLFETTLHEIEIALALDSAAIAVLSPRQDHFEVVCAIGLFDSVQGKTVAVHDRVSQLMVDNEGVYVEEQWQEDTFGGWDLPLSAAVFVPLTWGEESEGILIVARPDRRESEPFSDQDIRILTSVGDLLGVALHRIRLNADLQRRLRSIEALHKIDLAIAGNFDMRLTQNMLLDVSCDELSIDAAAILVFNPVTRKLEYSAGKGFRGHGIEKTALAVGEGVPGRAVRDQCMVHAPDPSASDEYVRRQLLEDEQFVAYSAVPLIAKGRVLGVLEVFDREARQRDNEWRALFETLGGQLAIALDSAILFRDLGRKHQELMEAYDETLEGWARALAMKEEETEEHSRRVVSMTMGVAEHMGMSEEALVHVRRGALLHDIGKIGIPDAILLKPGKLTEDEWAIMRQHTTFANDLLGPIPYLKQALDIPYCHHERWDGSGYPRGLKGKQIPLAARIFSVVDVYDALTSVRPYKKPWTRTAALDYLREQSGKQFDPEVVEIFIAWVGQSSA